MLIFLDPTYRHFITSLGTDNTLLALYGSACGHPDHTKDSSVSQRFKVISSPHHYHPQHVDRSIYMAFPDAGFKLFLNTNDRLANTSEARPS